MAEFCPAWRRHVRLDAFRYLRPEEIRFLRSNFEPRVRLRSHVNGDDWTHAAEQSRDFHQTPEVEFDADLRRQRYAIAKLRLDWELLKFALGGRKALHPSDYNPNQPRVPAGSPQGGQWSSEGVQGTPTRLAVRRPGIGHNSKNKPDVPKTKPTNPDERRAALKRAARWGGTFAVLYGVASWLREYSAQLKAYRDPPKTLEEMQWAAFEPTKVGYQDHHVIEQRTIEHSNFPESLVQSSENIVRIPTMKHREITGWFSSINYGHPYNGLSPREYLRDKSWEEHRRIGLQKLIDFGVLKP